MIGRGNIHGAALATTGVNARLPSGRTVNDVFETMGVRA